MHLIRSRILPLGILVMFALTWPVYNSAGPFIGWGLSIAALIVTGIAYGRGAVVSLLRRFLIWRVAPVWYLVAILGPALLYLLALALYITTTGDTPDPSLTEAHSIFGGSANVWLFIIPFFITDAITNGEELGWRGFLLPHLQARQTALVSSLLLGAIWGVWHLPRFWATGDTGAIAFAIVHNIAVAILFTWVYNSTGGSLLLVTLLHAAYSTAYVFMPVNPAAAGSETVRVFILAVEILAAIAVVGVYGPTTLSRQRAVQTQTTMQENPTS